MAVNGVILIALVAGVLRVSSNGSAGTADPERSAAAARNAAVPGLSASSTRLPEAPATPIAPAHPAKTQILSLTGSYFGISAPEVPWSSENLIAIVGSAGTAPNLIEYFDNFTQPFSVIAAASAYKHGALPVISLEPWNGSTAADVRVDARKPQFALAKITAGDFDGYFSKFAADVKAFGAPVAIRFAHEMNGGWYPWGETNGNKTGDYVKAWRHVHDLFTKAGADNVIWIWSPNNLGGAAGQITSLYPGDAYVDWVGMSAYITANSTPDKVIDPGLKAIRRLTAKPLLITETGAEPGTTKPARTGALFTWLTAHPDVIGFIWFEKTKADGAGTDWRFDSDTTTRAAFHSGLSRMTLAKTPTITNLGP